MDRETRDFAVGRPPVILRSQAAGIVRFSGHAAVFDQRTWIGDPHKQWGFWEQVAPGAFSRAIAQDDVAFLYNHNEDTVMARTGSGTLKLRQDDVGLVVEADLDPTDVDVARLVPKLERGDVSKMSFAFHVEKESSEYLDDGTEVRTIHAVSPLWDVSAVTYPAYAGTDAALRALVEARRAGCTKSQIAAARRRFETIQKGGI